MIREVYVYLPILISLILAGCAGQNGDSKSIPPDGNGTPSPLEPIPGEEKMIRGKAFIQESELLVLESYPLQIVLGLKGNLPTPCHYLRAEVSEPDDQNRIFVEVYSLIEPDVICVQVLQDFDSRIDLGSYPDGSYTVWVNGEQVGEFDQQ